MKKREFVKRFRKKSYSKFLLGADVGGTNTTFVVGGVKKAKIELIFSLRYPSKSITDFSNNVKEVLEYALHYYKIKPMNACFAVAGPVKTDHSYAHLTNGTFEVDAKNILKKTTLKTAVVINDFDAIGYGINTLNKKDFYKVKNAKRKQKSIEKSTKCLIGAGTGLGKNILIYDKHLGAYVTISSEGGHADLPVHNKMEWKLLEFIKKQRKISGHVSWEEVLSGHGIESIYLFLRKLKRYKSTKYSKEIDSSNDKVPLISKYRKKDKLCHATFALFVQFYARCARNFALETLALGGVYVAGGIAAKNKEIFRDRHFIKEFEHHRKQSELLQQVPITIITNYDVSLYGALFAALKRQDIAIKRGKK